MTVATASALSTSAPPACGAMASAIADAHPRVANTTMEIAATWSYARSACATTLAVMHPATTRPVVTMAASVPWSKPQPLMYYRALHPTLNH